MKKPIIFLAIIVIIILGIRFFLGGSEDYWICEGGGWAKHGNPSAEKPSEACPIKDKGLSAEDSTGGLFGILNKAKQLNKSSYTWDLSGQGIRSLTTEQFEGKGNIKIFDVSNNNLTGALPTEIRKLSSLEILRASNNNLTAIPAEIGQLDKIREIDFSHNAINAMPGEIINLADTLEVLNLSNNKYSPEQLESFEVMLPNTDIIVE